MVMNYLIDLGIYEGVLEALSTLYIECEELRTAIEHWTTKHTYQTLPNDNDPDMLLLAQYLRNKDNRSYEETILLETVDYMNHKDFVYETVAA